MVRVHGDQQKVRQKVHALKPEAQAEGIRVCCTKNTIPSARASGFLDFGFTQRNIKTRASGFPELASAPGFLRYGFPSCPSP